MIYWPSGDDHACQDVNCEYGHGVSRALAAQEYRRNALLVKERRDLTPFDGVQTQLVAMDRNFPNERPGPVAGSATPLGNPLPRPACGYDYNRRRKARQKDWI